MGDDVNGFERLVNKAVKHGFRLQVRYDPQETGEEWGLKLYPSDDDDAHYYAYNRSLESASRQLIDEVWGF